MDKWEYESAKPYTFFIADKVIVKNKNDSFYGKEGIVINCDHLLLQDNRYLVDFSEVINLPGLKQRTFFENELERANKRRK